MKRSFVISLALVLCLAAVAFGQKFTNFSVTVPSGYSATENSDKVVTLTSNSDSRAAMIIAVEALGSSSFAEAANIIYQNSVSDSRFSILRTLLHHEDGYYYFSVRNSNDVSFTVFLDDHNSDSDVDSGYIREFMVSYYVDDDVFNDTLQSFSQSGGGGDDSSSGCDTGLGLLTLGLAVVFFKKR